MPAACGASSTFGNFSSGEPVGGSASKTSRPAPARRPEVSAAQSAASSISPPRAVLIRKAPWLHQRELAPPDQMARLRRERGVQRDDVGFAQQLVQGHELDAGGGGERPIGDRIGGQQPHLERGRPPRHRLADPAEPDDPQAAAPEPRMEAAAPAPGGDPGVVRQKLDREPDREREGVVGHALVVGAEGHCHGHAMAGRGVDVDPVVADAEAGDHPQPGRRGEHPLGVRLATGNGRERARQALDQFGLAQQPVPLVDHDLEARVPQRREEACRPAMELLDVAQDLAQGRLLPECLSLHRRQSRSLPLSQAALDWK